MESSQAGDFMPEPDLHPLYPTAPDVSHLLSNNSGLSPDQKHTLVTHCITRSCLFADLSFLQYILHDSQAHAYIDLNHQDEDGLVFASITIMCFGAESDRDVEREECVRLLISEGADMSIPDKAGWTPLHHAALLAPPTLISYLLTHGCSPLSVTRRNLTALDIVTAYSVIPGREDIALFLEEAMKSEGWTSNKMSEQRRTMDEAQKRIDKRQSDREAIERILNLDSQWWKSDDRLPSSIEVSEDESDTEDETYYTPPLDYSSMLVFSPASLPGIFDTLIINFRPSINNSDPANALYMLARFACLACDHSWLEDLIMGATDAIEDVAFSRPDDLTYTLFWLYNCTIWLHLLRCDSSICETCELMGSFEVIQEVINAIYILIIRFAERHIDKLIDAALLDYSPVPSDLDAVQFESDWSLFRSFGGKKKTGGQTITPSSTAASLKSPRPGSPGPSPSRPSSPVPGQVATPQTPKALSSLRQTFNRARGASSVSSLQNIFADSQTQSQTPQQLVGFLSALHTLLIESCINPAIIVQLWSQVMYWTSSEVFNRILTRKRFLCRSRALQIGMNLSVVEEWLGDAGLPHGIETHFAPIRELLHWLQRLSSMDDFSNLIATIQTMKHLNPLQMRRAVRDYKYEVNEMRMGEDCSQYLVQLQKDWERQRVRLGVEALRKMGDRDKDYDDDDSLSSEAPDANVSTSRDRSLSINSIEDSLGQYSIDLIFDRVRGRSEWLPQQPPEILGELLESRYMLPLLLPSDPRMLAAVPSRSSEQRILKDEIRSASKVQFTSTGVLDWVTKGKKIRSVRVGILDWLDGSVGVGRWTRRMEADTQDENDSVRIQGSESSPSNDDETEREPNHVPLTRMTRVASRTSRHGRTSTG